MNEKLNNNSDILHGRGVSTWYLIWNECYLNDWNFVYLIVK